MLKIIRIIGILGLCTMTHTPVFAQDSAKNAPSPIGKFNDWGSYSYKTQAGTVCYVLTVPKTKQPESVDHGDNFFLVTQKKDKNYESQFMAGYELKANSKVSVSIDATMFSFFIAEKSAWLEDATQEGALLEALKNGKSMSIKATSKRGTATSYTYSLSGISKALESLKGCK